MFDISEIKKACAVKGLTLAELERKIGLGNGVIARWQTAKGSPQVDHLALIAKELDTSLDLIAFGKEKTAPTNEDGLNAIQRQLVQLIPLLDDADISVLLATAQSLIASRRFRDSE